MFLIHCETRNVCSVVIASDVTGHSFFFFLLWHDIQGHLLSAGDHAAGMVVTSLNLLPCGRLEGGRIAQALFGRNTATILSFGTSLLLGIGGLSGSVLCLAWGLFATFFRGGEELPAKDEITPLGDDRYAWGFVLALVCFLTLFPNGGGTFSSSFFGPPYFRGEI